MADDVVVFVNRKLEREISEILVLNITEPEFSPDEADFVHRRLDQMRREFSVSTYSSEH